jgi:hypothetical protein
VLFRSLPIHGCAAPAEAQGLAGPGTVTAFP